MSASEFQSRKAGVAPAMAPRFAISGMVEDAGPAQLAQTAPAQPPIVSLEGDHAGNGLTMMALDDRMGNQTVSQPDEQPSDEQLLRGFLGGKRADLEKLIHRYERELFNFLFRFLGDRSAADDMFQETFLQVYQSAATFDLSRRFKPWLFTIAANKARDLMRSQSRRYTSSLEAAFDPHNQESGKFVDLMQSVQERPGEGMEKEELAKMVRKVIDDIPAHLREVILLAYFNQFPYRQISEMLNVPLGTVKSRLHAAVAAFAQRWEQINKS